MHFSDREPHPPTWPSDCRAHRPASAAGERETARSASSGAVRARLSGRADGDSTDHIQLSMLAEMSSGVSRAGVRVSSDVSEASVLDALQRRMSPRALQQLLEHIRRPSAPAPGRDCLPVLRAVLCLHSCVQLSLSLRASRESPGRVGLGGGRR